MRMRTYHDVVEQPVAPEWGDDARAVRPERAAWEGDLREDAADEGLGLGDECARAADFGHVGDLEASGCMSM